LPNTDVPDRNYPTEYPIEDPIKDLTSKLSTVNKYDGDSAYTDKYFNPEKNAATVASYAPLKRPIGRTFRGYLYIVDRRTIESGLLSPQ
jgi:hypothetical protein